MEDRVFRRQIQNLSGCSSISWKNEDKRGENEPGHVRPHHTRLEVVEKKVQKECINQMLIN